jgi:hypothetical protein
MLNMLETDRVRREISSAVESFCLQYAIMDLIEQIRKNPMWWKPGKTKPLVEALLEHYEAR